MRNCWELLVVVVAVVLLVMCDTARAGWEPVDVSSPKVAQVFDYVWAMMNDDPAHYGEMVARVITAESIAADRLERRKLTSGEREEKSSGRAGGTNYRLVVEVRWVASGQSDRHEVLVHVSPTGEFTLEVDTIIRDRNSPIQRTLP